MHGAVMSLSARRDISSFASRHVGRLHSGSALDDTIVGPDRRGTALALAVLTAKPQIGVQRIALFRPRSRNSSTLGTASIVDGAGQAVLPGMSGSE